MRSKRTDQGLRRGQSRRLGGRTDVLRRALDLPGAASSFLLWLWISNIFVLLGAELNAELERSRALEAGEVSSEKEQFVELRETEKLEDE